MSTSTVTNPAPAEQRSFAWWLLIAGAIGLLASATLLIERIKLAMDPSYVPSCSLNPVLSCGSVMETSQAALLGFPNPVLGVAGFPIVLTAGAALLAGARLAPWFWAGLQAGVTLAQVFICWLAFESLYRIGALCPYCMVVWAIVVPLFLYVTLRNAERGLFGVRVSQSRAVEAIRDWAPLILVGIGLIVVTLIGIRFWDYWSTLF